uniref:Thioredoxin domain-containing protein n=1 Tax=Romanomermis culicivorax TaxID=13658 RepID=A0A915IVK9_ROMCU
MQNNHIVLVIVGFILVSDFIGYIDAQVGPPAPVDEPISPPAEVPADEDVGYQQADEDDTSDPESWGYVKMLTPENYRDVMNSVQRTLVMFFSPSCRYCEEVKPEFKAAAFRIKNRNDVALAALDCVQYLDACMDFRVAGYPSLFLFDKTNYVDIHHGKPTRENFVRTILAHLESEKGQPPSSTPPKSEL